VEERTRYLECFSLAGISYLPIFISTASICSKEVKEEGERKEEHVLLCEEESQCQEYSVLLVLKEFFKRLKRG
jgi:hypothetical protein